MLKGATIALVEDDLFMGTSLMDRLKLEGAEVIWFKQVNRALGAIRTPRTKIDVVICDIQLPDGTGEELFNTLCDTTKPPPFLFITGHGGIDQAVRLIQAGAADYVTKPFDIAVFLERLGLLLSSGDQLDMPPVLGVSALARRVETQAQQAAQLDRPVLIQGGPGTGKGLVARQIHAASDRRSAPFLTVNLAREPNVEHVLFGSDGLWQNINDGVLFLQGISWLPDQAVPKFLDAFETGFQGRLIASCGHEISEIIANDPQRADLFYRLNMMEIEIPSLGERTEDADWLMRQLFDRLNRKRAEPLTGISQFCEAAIHAHDWPGGGRELRARVNRGVENATGTHLQPADIFPEYAGPEQAILSLSEARESSERKQIIAALTNTEGRLGKAAEVLKVSRTTLWDKIHKLGIELDQTNGQSGE